MSKTLPSSTSNTSSSKSKFGRNLNALHKAPPAPASSTSNASYGNRNQLLVLSKAQKSVVKTGTVSAPVPLNTPSLKKENNGQDITVNLVPQGGSGWGQPTDKVSELKGSEGRASDSPLRARSSTQDPLPGEEAPALDKGSSTVPVGGLRPAPWSRNPEVSSGDDATRRRTSGRFADDIPPRKEEYPNLRDAKRDAQRRGPDFEGSPPPRQDRERDRDSGYGGSYGRPSDRDLGPRERFSRGDYGSDDRYRRDPSPGAGPLDWRRDRADDRYLDDRPGYRSRGGPQYSEESDRYRYDDRAGAYHGRRGIEPIRRESQGSGFRDRYSSERYAPYSQDSGPQYDYGRRDSGGDRYERPYGRAEDPSYGREDGREERMGGDRALARGYPAYGDARRHPSPQLPAGPEKSFSDSEPVGGYRDSQSRDVGSVSEHEDRHGYGRREEQTGYRSDGLGYRRREEGVESRPSAVDRRGDEMRRSSAGGFEREREREGRPGTDLPYGEPTQPSRVQDSRREEEEFRRPPPAPVQEKPVQERSQEPRQKVQRPFEQREDEATPAPANRPLPPTIPSPLTEKPLEKRVEASLPLPPPAAPAPAPPVQQIRIQQRPATRLLFDPKSGTMVEVANKSRGDDTNLDPVVKLSTLKRSNTQEKGDKAKVPIAPSSSPSAAPVLDVQKKDTKTKAQLEDKPAAVPVSAASPPKAESAKVVSPKPKPATEAPSLPKKPAAASSGKKGAAPGGETAPIKSAWGSKPQTAQSVVSPNADMFPTLQSAVKGGVESVTPLSTPVEVEEEEFGGEQVAEDKEKKARFAERRSSERQEQEERRKKYAEERRKKIQAQQEEEAARRAELQKSRAEAAAAARERRAKERKERGPRTNGTLCRYNEKGEIVNVDTENAAADRKQQRKERQAKKAAALAEASGEGKETPEGSKEAKKARVESSAKTTKAKKEKTAEVKPGKATDSARKSAGSASESSKEKKPAMKLAEGYQEAIDNGGTTLSSGIVVLTEAQTGIEYDQLDAEGFQEVKSKATILKEKKEQREREEKLRKLVSVKLANRAKAGKAALSVKVKRPAAASAEKGSNKAKTASSEGSDRPAASAEGATEKKPSTFVPAAPPASQAWESVATTSQIVGLGSQKEKGAQEVKEEKQQKGQEVKTVATQAPQAQGDEGAAVQTSVEPSVVKQSAEEHGEEQERTEVEGLTFMASASPLPLPEDGAKASTEEEAPSANVSQGSTGKRATGSHPSSPKLGRKGSAGSSPALGPAKAYLPSPQMASLPSPDALPAQGWVPELPAGAMHGQTESLPEGAVAPMTEWQQAVPVQGTAPLPMSWGGSSTAPTASVGVPTSESFSYPLGYSQIFGSAAAHGFHPQGMSVGPLLMQPYLSLSTTAGNLSTNPATWSIQGGPQAGIRFAQTAYPFYSPFSVPSPGKGVPMAPAGTMEGGPTPQTWLATALPDPSQFGMRQQQQMMAQGSPQPQRRVSGGQKPTGASEEVPRSSQGPPAGSSAPSQPSTGSSPGRYQPAMAFAGPAFGYAMKPQAAMAMHHAQFIPRRPQDLAMAGMPLGQAQGRPEMAGVPAVPVYSSLKPSAAIEKNAQHASANILYRTGVANVPAAGTVIQPQAPSRVPNTLEAKWKSKDVRTPPSASPAPHGHQMTGPGGAGGHSSGARELETERKSSSPPLAAGGEGAGGDKGREKRRARSAAVPSGEPEGQSSASEGAAKSRRPSSSARPQRKTLPGKKQGDKKERPETEPGAERKKKKLAPSSKAAPSSGSDSRPQSADGAPAKGRKSGKATKWVVSSASTVTPTTDAPAKEPEQSGREEQKASERRSKPRTAAKVPARGRGAKTLGAKQVYVAKVTQSGEKTPAAPTISEGPAPGS